MSAPEFTVTTDTGKTVSPDRFRRQAAGAEFLGDLVPSLHRGDAVA